MGRSTARELVRAAQAAELDKEIDRAVALLEEAARLHLTSGEPGRAAALFRHCLRLAPDRTDLEAARDAAEKAAEPVDLGEAPAAPSLPATVIAEVTEPPAASVEAPRERAGEPAPTRPAEPRRPRTLELPQRGPSAADPAIDCWCSFCCRPKSEVGPMVAGPAGAFICAGCIEGAAAIAGGRPAPQAESAAAAPGPAAPHDFVEAAVLLSRGLGWSLDEVRSLSPDERELALKALARLGPEPRR